MRPQTSSEPWVLLANFAESSGPGGIRQEAKRLGIREVSRAMARLAPDKQDSVIQALMPGDAASLFSEMAEAQSVGILTRLPVDVTAPIFNAMMSNTRANLLGLLPQDQTERLLKTMNPEAAMAARLLVQYPRNVAGGLMIREYLAYPSTYTTQQVVEDLRSHSGRYIDYSIQYTFVVDAGDHLVGVLSLRDLLLTPSDISIDRVMLSGPLFSVQDKTPLEELDQFFQEHAFLGVPVVDDQNRLMGVVRRSDVQAALGRKADTDYLKSQGIMGGEELRSMPLLARSGRRLSWLSINIVLNVLAASVIALFQDTLASVIALAVFIPIISDMSGCSGNQAVAVSMRELSLGLVKPFEVVHVWLKEVSVGLLNGAALGLIIALLAWLWQGNPFLGLVVGISLCINTLVAVSAGGLLPLLLKRMGVDPALAAAPILTTLTDMCGFFLILGIATLMLPLLT